MSLQDVHAGMPGSPGADQLQLSPQCIERLPEITMRCRATMEFDGYVNIEIAVSSATPIAVHDCVLAIPLRKAFATYMMGMGRKGGVRPETWEWQWDADKHQDKSKNNPARPGQRPPQDHHLE